MGGNQNTSSENLYLIDIEKMIRNQDNKLVRNLPAFIIRKIEKLVRLSRVNEAILRDHDKFGIDFIRGNLNYLNISVRVSGFSNVPIDGRYIYVCNHALGGIDFYAAIIAAYERHRKMKVIANEILMALKNLHPIFLPVNVFSRNNESVKQAIHAAMETIDYQIMTFPAGIVARKYNGSLDDGRWNPSFIKNAVKFERDIIPVFIDSENSKRFYRLANIRKKIGLKTNFEMFLLPDELFKKEYSTIPVIFGKPIPYTQFTDDNTAVEWTNYVKKIVYDLKFQTDSDTFELKFGNT